MRKILAIVLSMALLLAACGTVPSGSSGAVAETPHPTLTTTALGTQQDLQVTQAEIDKAKLNLGSSTVGIIACTMSTEYHSTVANAAKARAESLELTAEIFDAEAKADKQISAIENFVSKGSKVIILCVLDPKVIEAAVKEAAGQGVYIVQYAGRESAINGISVSIEDADLGCAAGEIAADYINKGKGGKATVAILDYPDLPQVVARADNIEKCLKQGAPNANIVGRFLGGTTENGLKSMETALQAHPDIDVVASINDAGAYGAMNALEAAGKDPKDTYIVGIDAEAQSKQLIKDGKFFVGTVDTSPKTTGEMAVDAVIKIFASATAPKNVRVPVTKITRDNIQ
jgi:ribose transport system substrate-binding protein